MGTTRRPRFLSLDRTDTHTRLRHLVTQTQTAMGSSSAACYWRCNSRGRDTALLLLVTLSALGGSSPGSCAAAAAPAPSPLAAEAPLPQPPPTPHPLPPSSPLDFIQQQQHGDNNLQGSVLGRGGAVALASANEEKQSSDQKRGRFSPRKTGTLYLAGCIGGCGAGVIALFIVTRCVERIPSLKERRGGYGDEEKPEAHTHIGHMLYADPTLEAATDEADDILAAQAAEAAEATATRILERKATAAAVAAERRTALDGFELQRRMGGAIVVGSARRGRTII